MNHDRDPERLTDDKDWIVHVSTRELPDRREDGLCMDTLTRSTKIRRKASIVSKPNPLVSQIPGSPEAVPRSVLNVGVPAMSPQNNPSDKQNGCSKNPRLELHESAGESSQVRPIVDPRSSPEVVKRSEYTWETMLRQPSDVRVKRSRSFNWDYPEYTKPAKPNGTTRSLYFDKEVQEQRVVQRSKSLRGNTHCTSSSSHAAETPPFNKIIISVKREGEKTKRKKPSKNPEDQRTVTDAGNVKSVKVKKGKATEQTRKVNRSGSAPSMGAKEKVVKHEVNGIPKRRHSYRWIPEPDYQSVSIEELVSATQKRDKAISADHVCVVEIHNSPKDRDPIVSTVDTDSQVVNISQSTSSQQPSPSLEEQNNYSTIIDLESTLPVPGVAKRMPSVLNAQSPEDNEGTNIESTNTRERKLSVKNRVQNFETQISHGVPSSGHSQAITSERNYYVDTTAPSTIDNNNNSITLPNSRTKQAASETRTEPNINNSQTRQPSSKTKPSEIRSIGKLTIVKHVETPARRDPEKTLNNPIREDPAKNLEIASSTKLRQLTDTKSIGNATIPLRETEEPRQIKPSPVPPPPPPPPPPFTMNPWSSGQARGNDVKTTISPKDMQNTSAAVVQRAKEAKEAIPLTIEEKKKTWKREHIVDKLHSDRARNSNQNYIFGTGLAYQSCMPELQNKLKQLALAK